jgi:hypothetical protein
MKLKLLPCLLVVLPLLSSTAQEEIPQSAKNPGYLCSFVQETRTLNVLKSSDGNGCELEYIKYGAKEIPATSKSGNEICLKVMEKIKVKLESVGFDCVAN